jgi:hypothetical protein
MKEAQRVHTLAGSGAAGVWLFALAVIALHLLPTGLDPIGRTVSEYVNQPYGWLVPIAGVGLGAGSLALTLALAHALPAPRPRAGLALLAVWGLAMILAAAFPTDPAPPGRPIHLTATGAVHVIAGVVAFLALAVAAPLISRAISGDPTRVAAAVRTLAVLAPLGLLLFVATAVNRPPISRLIGEPNAWGLGERVMVAVYVAWLLCVAAWVIRSPGARAAPDSSSE